ncbi:YbaK/EbsC family protein, partial [Bacillus thuringiensis]|uniref:YbaK/EbsC family protein n=1 Tax=Bacillus thuringiensis TaxID=1428 RepID=UPI002852ADBE
MLYIADDQKVLVLIRGDKQINEVKLGHVLDADDIHEANTEDLKEITGSEKGGVGPVNADWADKIIADETVKGLYNVVVGAGETDYQFKNANLDRDFKVDEFADIRTANEGEPDPVDHLPLKF